MFTQLPKQSSQRKQLARQNIIMKATNEQYSHRKNDKEKLEAIVTRQGIMNIFTGGNTIK